jgi:hypothetical protein
LSKHRPLAPIPPSLEKAKSYFAEIDQLLSKERNWIVPFIELNERYSPLEDCDTDLPLQ